MGRYPVANIGQSNARGEFWMWRSFFCFFSHLVGTFSYKIKFKKYKIVVKKKRKKLVMKWMKERKKEKEKKWGKTKKRNKSSNQSK